MLGTVSYYCEIVFKTIVFKMRGRFSVIQLQKCSVLEIQARQGHWKYHHLIEHI